MFGNSLQRLVFTAFFIGASALQVSPVLAIEFLPDLIKSPPAESCYNICQCDFTGITYQHTAYQGKDLVSVKTCDNFDADYVSYSAAEINNPFGALSVDLSRDICKFVAIDDAIGVNCRIREVVKVDACKMAMGSPFKTPFNYIVERDGTALLTPESLPSRQPDQNLVNRVTTVLNSRNRCPTLDSESLFSYVDPEFADLFDTYRVGLGGTFSSAPLFKEGACCCQKTDEGALTSVYSCSEGGRYPGYDCKGNIMTDSSQSFVKPLPTAPATCSSYDTVNKKEYKAGDSNFDIGTQKLRTEAKKLNKLGVTNINQIIGRIIQGLMMFIGAILLVMYIYAGLLWMFANGNEERITSAKSILVWSTLGVAVMLGSYVIINFIFSSLNL